MEPIAVGISFEQPDDIHTLASQITEFIKQQCPRHYHQLAVGEALWLSAQMLLTPRKAHTVFDTFNFSQR